MSVDQKPSAILDSRVAARRCPSAWRTTGARSSASGCKVASIPTSIFWLPNATMFAVFLLAPVSRWWIYALAVLPAHVAVQMPHHVPPAAFVAALPQQPRRRRARARLPYAASRGAHAVRGFRSVAVFLLFAVAAPLVVSFADAAAVTLTGWAPDFRLIWHTRFRSNVLTNLIWVPAVVIGATARRAPG